MRRVNGFTQCRPESRMVPRYRPNSCTTGLPGTTAMTARHDEGIGDEPQDADRDQRVLAAPFS